MKAECIVMGKVRGYTVCESMLNEWSTIVVYVAKRLVNETVIKI